MAHEPQEVPGENSKNLLTGFTQKRWLEDDEKHQFEDWKKGSYFSIIAAFGNNFHDTSHDPRKNQDPRDLQILPSSKTPPSQKKTQK